MAATAGRGLWVHRSARKRVTGAPWTSSYLIATPVRTWQATQCPCETSLRTCSFCEHDGTRSAQRVWKRHPEGGLIGLGTSPSSRIRLRFIVGSGIGTADRSASVYGCFGFV